MKKLSELELALKKIATVVQDRLSTKQNVLTAGTGITIALDGTISATGGEGEVQSDWNLSDSTADDYIKNKPTIPTVPTNVSSFTNDAGYLTSHQDISGKQNKVAKLGSTTKPVYTSATGTFAECSTYAGGTKVTLNGTDKGASTASFYAPTSAGTSGYYLKSNGSGAPTWDDVSSLIDDISEQLAVTTLSSGTSLTAVVGKYYVLTYNVGTLAITLPTPTGTNAQSIIFTFKTGTNPHVTFTSSGNTIYKSDGFSIIKSTRYEINALWNTNAWIIFANVIS